jgi:hypothetical protein
MKHLEQTLATYIYSHCNIRNILIYFCNIHMKYLQHTSETSETLETDVYSMRFSAIPGRPVGGRSTAQRDPVVWVAVEKEVAAATIYVGIGVAWHDRPDTQRGLLSRGSTPEGAGAHPER